MSQATKQPAFMVVFAVLVLFTVLLFTPIGFIFTTTITFLLPAFSTFKALETKENKDDKRMLTFWICFGFLYLFDSVLSYVFSFLIFYHIIRAGVILYLYLP